VDELGVCPAATDAFSDTINRGSNAGRFCWTAPGTLCDDERQGDAADKTPRCGKCSFFRRVKYEEGCHFQLRKPRAGASDAGELHRIINDLIALLGICRDIFTCLDTRPLLALIVRDARRITRACSASAYLATESGDELLLEAHEIARSASWKC